ncbi:MAG: hypothetical protein IT368_09395 [Candidatus Hydrogenedentes bacterium]|nr:hypothetical protein [Candidatus Hydrogenedentota bacterium]
MPEASGDLIHLKGGKTISGGKIVKEDLDNITIEFASGAVPMIISKRMVESIERAPTPPRDVPATAMTGPPDPPEAPAAPPPPVPAPPPNDRLPLAIDPSSEFDPKIYLVVNGKDFARPALETYFAEGAPAQRKLDVEIREICTCDTVAVTYCTCNKVSVCRCVSVCSCVSHRSCSCDSHRSSGGGVVTGCRCAPVH